MLSGINIISRFVHFPKFTQDRQNDYSFYTVQEILQIIPNCIKMAGVL